MRKLPILLALLALTSVSIAQEAQMLDSMKLELQAAKTSAERVNLLDIMSRTMMNINLEQAEEYGKKLIQEAEESRDRLLMFTAYISNGVRCSYYSGVGDYLKRSIEYYEKALTIAKENRMEQQVGEAYMKLSQIHLVIPDREKALKYCNQAFSIITNLKHDSLQAQAHNLYGDVYLSSNENILSLRHYFTAMRIAETTKLPTLLRSCYMNLSDFYTRIADFDKSLDYAMKAHHQLDKIQDKRVAYMRVTDVNKIGNLYAAKKNHDLAISYFERSVSMADSLKYTSLKVPGYISLLNQYLRMEQPARALEYFNSPRGKELRDHLNGFGFTGVTDQAYAVIYTGLNNLDSAKYYFERAMPYFEKNADIVIGSRNTERKGSPLSRQIISRGLIVLRKTIVGLHDLTDTNCGFKAFRHDVAKKVFQRIYDMHNGYKTISGSSNFVKSYLQVYFYLSQSKYHLAS